jgi:hypothetical protein
VKSDHHYDEAALRRAWEAGFMLGGYNGHIQTAEQKEAYWQTFLRGQPEQVQEPDHRPLRRSASFEAQEQEQERS